MYSWAAGAAYYSVSVYLPSYDMIYI